MLGLELRRVLRLLLLSVTLVATVGANGATLRLASDLVIHPEQLSALLSEEAKQFRQSDQKWPLLQFTQPYHTTWTNVEIHGPFHIQLNGNNLAHQEIGVDWSWNTPSVQVGKFEIHDIITRQESGVTLIIHLDGSCTGMALSIPSGAWHIRGHLKWNVVNGKFTANWTDFKFERNTKAPVQVDLGQCQAPGGLTAEIKSSLMQTMRDTSWLQEKMKENTLDYVRSTLLTQIADALLTKRQTKLATALTMQWEPRSIALTKNGMLRLAGETDFIRAGVFDLPETFIKRTYTDAAVTEAKDSGLLLPRQALSALVRFLARTDDLRFGVPSDKIPSFQDLMNSRFSQFFVWPDLMNFDPSTKFWFQFDVLGTPLVQNGRDESNGGILYDTEVPLIVHQYAPAHGRFVPYLDFRSNLTGAVYAKVIDSQALVVRLYPLMTNVTATFRPEYQKIRPVDTRISEDQLSSDLKSYLSKHIWTIALPSWPMTHDISLKIKSAQVWRNSFRLPLGIESRR